MASIIRIKRSSGNSKPPSLNWGELAYVTGSGSFSGITQNSDRVYIGNETNNVITVGGRYYTSMMDHQPGSVAGVVNSINVDGGIVAVLDSNRKVDEWNVDNLRLDGNTLSSTNADGNIIFNPSGNGKVVIPDDTLLNFGDDNDVSMSYNEISNDRFEITGADWYFNNGVALKIDDNTQSTNKDTGALVVNGGVGIENDLNVGGSITGNSITVTQSSVFGLIRIKDNIISTVNNSGNILYIDPYADGLSGEGTVVIKGNLQVDGEVTYVNSTTLSVNDPIILLGDVTSQKTVMSNVVVGVNTIRIDSISGISTGDVVSGNAGLSLSGISTIVSYDIANKIITIQDNVISGISSESQLIITHAFDTNTDRGVSFNYNTSNGIANNKTGFFGYIDGANVGSSATVRSWTYIPDASIANSVVSGTRGFIDIKGIYYQTGDFDTHGIVYFNQDGLQTSTNNPANSIFTSKQVLTAVSEINLILPSNVTVSVGDIVRQETTNAYGFIKTGGTLSTLTITGVEGTFNTVNNLTLETTWGGVQNLSIIPSTVNIIHTNKPTWTSTIDGGSY